MGPSEFVGSIGAYPSVSHVGGMQGTLIGLGLAIIAVAIVTGIAMKCRTPS